MEHERWLRIESIVREALPLNPADRPAFLDKACAGNPEIREEAESLLQSIQDTPEFMETPLLRIDEESFSKDEDKEWEGKTLGPWRIGPIIGRGGMGVVYEAKRADGAFEQKVAIKLVKRGMDTIEILRRFEVERQTLAQLDHPYIARLLDGGTTEDGRPYLAMEHCEGKRIDRFADEKRLTIVQRVRLFREVCKAVQYAHQNLVVHRDLKPANVLIGKEGIPKLLDFGLAKVLQNRPAGQTITRTLQGQGFLTLEYASPEQFAGLAVTTTSDVYSLGVILYELLTGHRPADLDGKTPGEIEATILRQEPLRPSVVCMKTLQRRDAEGHSYPVSPEDLAWSRQSTPRRVRTTLAGELDHIVLMALRKEPDRRYPSAGDLAEDLSRYLAGRPVVARPSTLGYRSEKFIARNKLAVSAAAAVSLSLLGGIFLVSRENRLKTQALAQAEARALGLQDFAGKVIAETMEEIRHIPGTTKAQAALVQNLLVALDGLLQTNLADSSLQRELARAYLKLGSIQWSPFYSNLGDMTGAVATLEKAVALLEEALGPEPSPKDVLDLAVAHFSLGELYSSQHQIAKALASMLVSLDSIERFESLSPESHAEEVDKAWVHTRLGHLYYAAGDKDKALEFMQAAAHLYERQSAENPKNLFMAVRLAEVLSSTGQLLAEGGKDSEAREFYRRAISSFPELHESASDSPKGKGDAANRVSILRTRAKIWAKLGEHASVDRDYQTAIRLVEKFSFASSTNILERKIISSLHIEAADYYFSNSEPKHPRKALDHYLEGLKTLHAIVAVDPADMGARREAAMLERTIGIAHKTLGEEAAALHRFESYFNAMESLVKADPDNKALREQLEAERRFLENAQMRR